MFIVILLIMGINIFFSIPFIIERIIKKKNIAFLIALFFAVIAYFSIISNDSTHDLRSYYALFNASDIYKESAILQQKLYIVLFFTILKKLALPQEMIPFITNFTIYYLLLKIYEKNSKLLKENGKYCIYICLFIFLIPFSGYLGVRFFLATSLSIYGVTQNKKKYALFYQIFSTFVHYTMIIPLIVYFFTKIFKLNLRGRKQRIILIIIFIVGYFGINRILLAILDQINLNVSIGKVYILGKWGNDFWQRYKGIRLYIYLFDHYLRISFLFFLGYLMSYNKYRIKKYNYLESIVIYLIIFCGLMQNYKTLFDRFSIYTLLLSFIIIIKNNKIINRKKVGLILNLSIFFIAFINFVILFEKTSNTINMWYNYSFGKILYEILSKYIG